MTSTVLLTGASGLLGSALLRTAPEEHQIIALCNTHPLTVKHPAANTRQSDLTDLLALETLFEHQKIDLVINCAGAVDVDRCETDQNYAIAGNMRIVRNLLAASAHFPFRLLHFSTDYVFSGDKGPASEKDLPNPVNFYGKSKLSGEQLISSTSLEATIVRVCALYSIDPSARDNPYSKIVRCLQTEQTYPAASDLMNNPTEVGDLAAAIWAIAFRSDLPGLLHLASPEYVSRYDFACQVALYHGLNRELIRKVESTAMDLPARRPKYAGLISLNADHLIGRNLRSFSEISQTTAD